MAEETFTVEPVEAAIDTAELLKTEKTALALIARAEQCSWKLKCKLEKKKYSSGAIQTVIDHLLKLDLLNDRRYSELWLKDRIGRGNKGPRIFLQLLGNKGIDRETAAEALTALLTPETETALLKRCLEKAVQKDIVTGKSAVYAGKKSTGARMAARHFLKMQGFSAESINRYFEELE